MYLCVFLLLDEIKFKRCFEVCCCMFVVNVVNGLGVTTCKHQN